VYFQAQPMSSLGVILKKATKSLSSVRILRHVKQAGNPHPPDTPRSKVFGDLGDTNFHRHVASNVPVIHCLTRPQRTTQVDATVDVSQLVRASRSRLPAQCFAQPARRFVSCRLCLPSVQVNSLPVPHVGTPKPSHCVEKKDWMFSQKRYD